MRIGIVTGMPQEAEAILPGDGEVSRHGRLELRDTGSAVIASAGLGKVHAAIAATSLVAMGCTLLVKAGVAGRIAPIAGDCFWIASTVQHDYGALRGGTLDAFTAGALPLGAAVVEPFVAISDPGLHLPHARMASGDQFVADAHAARRIAATHGAQLVDMETAAVAQVAAAHGVGWAAINAVTDDADAGGVDDFTANLAAAAARAARATERLVELLGD